MSSPRRIAASRANGRRSHGPPTPAGKARSSRNAFKHGFFSRSFHLAPASDHELWPDIDDHIRYFSPADPFQLALVREMALCRWRLRRLWTIEKEWLAQAWDSQPDTNPTTRLANAFASLAETSKFDMLQRCENRFHRKYLELLHTLLSLRKKNVATNPSSPTAPAQTVPASKNVGTNLIPFPNTRPRKRPNRRRRRYFNSPKRRKAPPPVLAKIAV